MSVVSIRFSAPAVYERLKQSAKHDGTSTSALAERLIDEGLRMRAHPRITFRDGPAGRRPGLVGGPDVREVVTAIVGGDVATADRVSRAAELMSLRLDDVEAAMRYYADFTDAVDDEIRDHQAFADAAEEQWRRQQELTSR